MRGTPSPEFEAERHRVLAEILGDIVDEAFDGEGVVAVADAAPRRQPCAAVLDNVLGELVGNRILRNRRALHHDAVLPRFWIAGDVSHDGFGNDTVMPGDELAGARRSRLRCDAPSPGGICRR